MQSLNWTALPAWPLGRLDRALAAFLCSVQPTTDERHPLLAALTSHQYARGHACLDLQALAADPALVLGWSPALCAAPPASWWAGLTEAAATCPWTQGPTSPLVWEAPRLYLRRNWLAEQRILASIRERLAPVGAAAAFDAGQDLRPWLDRLFPPGAAAAAVEGGPPNPPDWQKVACALAARGRLTVITGGPGTGKTTTVVRLLALLQAQARAQGRTLSVALAAPTGKAATRLGESIANAVRQLPENMQENLLHRSSTLHRLLHIRDRSSDGPSPVLPHDVVVVDEASMIDLDMMARLMAAVPASRRLVLLGDKDQLASVEAGAVMGQLCAGAEAGGYWPDTVAWVAAQTGADVSAWGGSGTALAQTTVMLRHSRRFAGASAIGHWARIVNAGDVPAVRQAWDRLPHWRPTIRPDLQPPHVAAGDAAGVALGMTIPEVDRLEGLTAATAAAAIARVAREGWADWLAGVQALVPQAATACSDAQALSLLAAWGAFQVLCAVREGPWGVVALNRLLARALGFPEQGWYAGRPVIVTRNDAALGLMNGDVGLCLPALAPGGSADAGEASVRLRVAFADGEGGVRWVSTSRLDAVESVFAMTVHKSQGSEFGHACVVLPDRPSPVLTRELVYTGLTRAKQRLTLALAQPQVLDHAVGTRVLRAGGLAAGLA